MQLLYSILLPEPRTRCFRQRFVVALFISLFCLTSQSQVGTLNTLAAPVSPTAAGLGKYVEVPVGYYSGIPQINVPLYTIGAKGIAIPISLNYHASGIKVKEIAGPTGLGWTLQAGGVITRIVRGHPDTHDPYVTPIDGDDYNDSIMKRRVVNAYNTGLNNEFSLSERYSLCLTTPGVVAANAVKGFPFPAPAYPYQSFNRRDTEIDLYYFNFPGYTGQFTFTNDGKPMLLGVSDLKIEYLNRIFKLTDGNGVEYYFGAIEQSLDEGTDVAYYAGGSRMYTLSWYLSKVYVPQGNQTISFSYTQDKNYNLYPTGIYTDYKDAFYSRVDRIRYINNTIANYPYGNGLGGCPVYDRESPSTAPHYFADNLFLDEIRWNNNVVKFYGSKTRTDLYKFRYDSIKISAGSAPVRKIDLKYGYFNASSPTTGEKRLRLDSVLIADQKYSFSYYDSLHGKGLPVITSKGQDMWGYFNGETDEAGIPYYKIFDAPHLDIDALRALTDIKSSAIKNPDYHYGQLGTLKTLTYPTGATTFFEYEGNSYSYYPFVYSLYTIESDPYTQFKFDSTMFKDCSTFTHPTSTISVQSKEREFVLHNDQQATLTTGFRQYAFNNLGQYMDSVYYYGAEAHACLKKYNDSTHQFETVKCYDFYPVDSIGLPSSQSNYDLVKYKAVRQITESINLKEGRYKFTVSVRGWYMIAGISLTETFPYKNGNSIYNAGGLRIKKIQFKAATEQDTSYVKQYDYSQDTLSSGVLESPFANMSTSSFCDYYRSWSQGQYEYQLQEACVYFNLTSDPVIPLGNAQGGVIGYSKVTERREDNSKTVYYFTNGQQEPGLYADQFTNSPSYPTRIRVQKDNSWKRGLPVQTAVYDAGGSLVSQHFSTYLFDDATTNNRSMSLALDNVVLYPGGPLIAFDRYSAEPFFFYRGNQNAFKIKDSVIEYSKAGKLTNVTKYEYKEAGYPHTYPTRMIRQNSRGQQLVTNFRYPQDYSPGTSPTNTIAQSVKLLLDKHVVAPFIEKYVEKDARVVAGQYVRFKTALAAVDTVFNLEPGSSIADYAIAGITAGSASRDSRYKGVVNFNKYNKYGDVIEQATQNNVKEVLVWGYNYQYIVARIVNSDSLSVMSLIDTNVINKPVSDEQLRKELNRKRTGLLNTKALVTTYTWAPLTGMTSETDAAGRTTWYDYDAMGRLALVRDHNKNIIRRICYSYQGQPQACSWFGNMQKSKSFLRTNCTNDSTGRDTTYVVAAGTYYATTQAAADSLAAADINVNGQDFANSKGRCVLLTFYSSRVYGNFYSDVCDNWMDAQPYYIDVPAGQFISHISQEDADAQAWWYGQEQANLHGVCIHYVDLYFISYNTAAYNYQIILTNTTTYEQYYFNAFYGSGWLSSVPSGTYDIQFYGYDPWSTHAFRAGCYSWNYMVTSTAGWYYTNLYDIIISDGCNKISMDYFY